MADSFDRHENEGNGGGGFMMGLLTGTVLGAGLGMLLAPKTGSELRGAIGEQAKNLGNAASEQYKNLGNAASEQYKNLGNAASEQYKKASEAAGTWAEQGRDLVNKAKEAVARGADEARGSTGSGYSSGSSGSSFGTGSNIGSDRDFGKS
jgi:gas vesicle protein